MDVALTAPRPGLLINRNFALLWAGQAISTVGDFVFNTTLVLWIGTVLGRGQQWAPLAVSGVMVATAVPTMFIGPLAGVFVDRWDKRRLMLAMDGLRALLILLLLPAAGVSPWPGLRLSLPWQLGAIYATVVLTTACSQFFSPARLALIGDVVEEPYRPRASSMEQATMSLAIVIGPPLAAPLLFGLGASWALAVNALSFVASFLALLAIRAPRIAPSVAPGERGSVLGEFGQGLRLCWHNRVLRTIIVSAIIVMLGVGALNALDVFFVTGNLHTPASLYGLLSTALGIGALGGAILAGLYAGRIGIRRLFWGSLLALGVIILVYARLTSFVPALATLFLLGLPNAALNVSVEPLLLEVTPRDFVGRVTALLMPAMSLASIGSIAVAGLLVSTVLHGFHATIAGVHLGPIDTVFTATGLLTIIGALYAMVNLRRETPHDRVADMVLQLAPAGVTRKRVPQGTNPEGLAREPDAPATSQKPLGCRTLP